MHERRNYNTIHCSSCECIIALFNFCFFETFSKVECGGIDGNMYNNCVQLTRKNRVMWLRKLLCVFVEHERKMLICKNVSIMCRLCNRNSSYSKTIALASVSNFMGCTYKSTQSSYACWFEDFVGYLDEKNIYITNFTCCINLYS